MKNSKGRKIIQTTLNPNASNSGFEFYSKTKLSLKDIRREISYSKQTLELLQRTHYKTYPRLPQVSLEASLPLKGKLAQLLALRQSQRTVSRQLSFETLSEVLILGAGTISGILQREQRDNWKRTYPSAGARYPIETYVYCRNVSGLKRGIYHFNVKNNTLEVLTSDTYYLKRFEEGFPKSKLNTAAVTFVFTAVFQRNTVKYGPRGFRHMFIECGHIAQNIYLFCAEQKLPCCAIGGFSEDVLIEALDLYENNEVPLYALALGGEGRQRHGMKRAKTK